MQAKSALLPALSHTTQYLGTQSNDITPNGRFVANDGVHMFRSWAVLRQEISAQTLLKVPYQRAQAARRWRKPVSRSHSWARRHRDQKLLRAHQRRNADTPRLSWARSRPGGSSTSASAGTCPAGGAGDVVKAELQSAQQEQNYRDAQVAMAAARLNLAVLLFPTLNEISRSSTTSRPRRRCLPSPRSGMAARGNPDVRAAAAALDVAHQDVRTAQHAFWPSSRWTPSAGSRPTGSRCTASRTPFEAGVLPNLKLLRHRQPPPSHLGLGRAENKVRQTEMRNARHRSG